MDLVSILLGLLQQLFTKWLIGGNNPEASTQLDAFTKQSLGSSNDYSHDYAYGDSPKAENQS
jgi:hypothetical protein